MKLRYLHFRWKHRTWVYLCLNSQLCLPKETETNCMFSQGKTKTGRKKKDVCSDEGQDLADRQLGKEIVHASV